MTDDATPVIDVCIATYKRPEGLRKLLRSLIAQETGGAFRIAIHVADNDAAGSAEPVIRELEAEGHPISYAIEPRQNIALARNKSISFAKGDYVAITDDDMYADPHWLEEMYATLKKTGAEVVVGRNDVRLPPGAPRYIRVLMTRPAPPTGSRSGFISATGNTMIRRAVIRDLAEPFDPRFGLTGGEDTDFFHRLRDAGCRVVFCGEAIIVDEVRPSRARLGWIVKRRLMYGLKAAKADRTPLTARATRILLRDILILGAAASVWGVVGVVRPEKREKALTRFWETITRCALLAGRIGGALGVRHEEYRSRNPGT